MNDRICPICKYHGKISKGGQSDTIFHEKSEVRIHLCYYHSVALFKNGQKNFMAKYHEVFRDYDLLSRSSFTSKAAGLINF